MTPATVRATFRLHVKIGVLRVLCRWCPNEASVGTSPRHHSDPGGPSASRTFAAPPYPAGTPRILRTCDVGSRSDSRTSLRPGGPDPRGRRRAGPAAGAHRDRAGLAGDAGDRLGRRCGGLVARAGARPRGEPGCPGRGRRFPPLVDHAAPARGSRADRRPLRPRRDGRHARCGARRRCARHRPRASRTSSRSSAVSATPRRPPGARLPAGTSAPSTGRWSSMSSVGGTLVPGAVLRRERGRPGDVVVVTGTLGRAAAGLRLLLDGGELSDQEQAWVDAQLSPAARHRRGAGADLVRGALRRRHQRRAARRAGADHRHVRVRRGDLARPAPGRTGPGLATSARRGPTSRSAAARTSSWSRPCRREAVAALLGLLASDPGAAHGGRVPP